LAAEFYVFEIQKIITEKENLNLTYMEQKPFVSKFLKFKIILFRAFGLKSIFGKKPIIGSILPDPGVIRRFGVICLSLLLFSQFAMGQAAGDYRSLLSGNWNANTTWEKYNGTAWNPCLAGDYPGTVAGAYAVYISANSTVTVTANVDNNIGALIFNSANASNIVQFSGAFSMNIIGAVTINPPSGGVNNNGIFVNSGNVSCTSLISSNSWNNSRDCKVAITDGILNVNGNISMGIASGQNDITFSGDGTLNVTGNLSTGQMTCAPGSVINIGGTFSPTAFTVSTSTVNFNGADQNISNFTYFNLSCSGSGTKTLPNATITVNGDLDVSNSILAYTSTQLRTLVVNGNLSGNGTIDASPGGFNHILTLNGPNNAIATFIPGSGTVYYSGAAAQQIFAGTYYNLTSQTSNQTRTIQGDLVVLNNLTVTLGTFDFGNSVARNVVVSGNLAGAGTINMSGVGLAHSLSLGGVTNNITTFSTTNGSGSTVNYTLSGNQQVFASANYQNVNIGGFAIKTLNAGNTTINGNLDISGATLAFNAGSTQTLTIAGNLSGNGTMDMSPGNRTHTLNLGGASNSIGTLNTAAVASTINYNGAGDQSVFGSSNYRNLTISGGGIKTMQGSINVGNTLTLTSGVLQLGGNDLTLTNATAIGGGPFDAATMIETDGAGRLIRTGNLTNQSFNLIYPVGSGGFYNPLIITNLPGIAAAARTITVRAVPLNPDILTNGINKYWDLITTNITTQATTLLSFQYNAAEVFGDPLLFQPYTNGSGNWALATGPSLPGSNPSTSTGSATITGFWTVGSPGTFYSYQSGYWDLPSTWTFDPGGTTGPGTQVPGQNDKVVILSGRTVSLEDDDFTQSLDITINNGGILDLTTWTFGSQLAALRGSGTLKLTSSNFPSSVINTFVTTDGGTAEYNFNGPLSASQTTYYNLTIRVAGGTSVQVNDLTLNGNLNVKEGTFQINDAISRRLKLIINGDVTVDNTGSIAVGSGGTRTSAGPLPSITGNTGAFLNYYELNSHRIQIYGNFTNNGIVRFSNLSNPVYNAFPANGFATVYFQGLSDKTLTCNGQTDFYNLVVDKGSDQTFKLTVNSSAYNNFRLFGANISDGSASLPPTPAGNPNLKKALWIKNGSLVLQGLVAIPSLSEGSTAGTYPSDFFIPANGAMILDGAGVIVLSTADDYSEVNAAYGLSGGSNATYGINPSGGYSGLSVLGTLLVNSGYLSTRESSGLLYWSYAPGQIIINGGKIDTKQFHNPEGGAAGLISFVQNGGNLIIRGRFNNTINYAAPADLANPVMNTFRVIDGIDPAAGIGAFSMNSNAANGFTMSGGTISVYDVCNTSATPLAFLVNSPVSNINVTGGTVRIIPTTGTALPDANYLINTTAPFNNLIINRVSGLTSVQLNSNPLVVLGNLTLTSGDLIANNLDVTVGGDFSLASGTTYTAGTNTTLFNGTANQTFTINIAAPLSLNNFSVNKTAGIVLNLAGTQSLLNVSGNFSLVLGTLNDNGKTVNISGNIFNSGTHAGAGKIVLNGVNVQTIDGNGVFGNLELNNTNASAAPVSLLANITLNGLLTFSQNKLFNINTYNVRLNATSTIVNGGPLRYIKTAGNAGDGGLTKVYSSPGVFIFPVGVVNYTPASLGLSAAPTTYGSVTVTPVNFAHPNVTTPGRSLSYFWRVKSSGFNLGSATVTHGYTYAQANVVTGAGITEDEYVAARFDVPLSTWTRGTSADVDETNNIIGEPGAGNFLENVSFIDGDYTAGDDNPVNPFGTPKIYYSRLNGAAAGSGLWSNVNTWSTDAILQHTGAPATSVPGAGDIVVIGGLDSVYLATNNTVSNTDVRSCASLQIKKGSALDIGYNPNSSFGLVLNSPGGNGNFRLTTSWNSGSTFQFPSGDFSDFNVNLGTTELYSTNPAPNTTYWLPNGVYSYGNLILSPLGGSNIIFPNNDLRIYGNLVTRGQNADSWFCPTWNVNYPTAPSARIAKTITIDGNLDIQGGSLIWYGNGNIAQNFVINGDVKVATLSALDVWSGATNQSMAIGGSLINNTDGLTHGLNTTCKVDFTTLPLTFFGSTNATISNTAGTPLTVFSTVTVNKGTSQATTLTCDIAGTLTTPVDNWLTLQNGTFRYMRTNPSSDFTISRTTPFAIPATAGLLINLPSNTGNTNILIGSWNNDNGDLLLSGKLTLISGNVYIGRTTGTDNNNNDIEYTSSGASEIEIQGGNLYVNGQIRRDPLNASGILKYTQSGGTVQINGQKSNGTNAKLEVVNAGSSFNMTNGTLTIVRGNGALPAPSSPFGDLYLRPETGSVTGGTIVFSHTGLNAPQNYFLDANIPLNNITISGVSATNYSTVRLLISPLIVNGNMTINANSVLNSNNINITFNGNLINTPGIGGYVYGTNLTTFSTPAGGPFGGIQTVTGATNFYDLVVNPGTSLTLSNPSTVNRNLSLITGTFVLGSNPVTLLGNLSNDASYTDDNSVGSGIILNGAAQQQISGSGAFARLTLNNAAGARVENNITLQEDLTMTTGILDIKKNLITLGVNSLIQGAPFGATKMITSDGVFSNVGLRKFFNPGATTFLYPIGTSGKYTPGLLTITTSNTVGYVRINNISSRHPAVIDPANSLNYYWEVQSSGITNFSGNLVLNYLQGDVAGDEANYMAARLIVPGTTWSLTSGVDPVLNKITTNYVASNNLSGEYTAGIASAFPTNVPVYTSNADGNWTNPAIWTQTGGDPYPCPPGGPNGFIVIINHVVTLDANYCSAYRTTINNKLKVTASFYGHNLGTVNGNGTLYLESGSFPAGVYTSFLGCANNSTVEYGGTGTYTIIADLYDDIANIVFSGTGTRVLPNKDLTICNQFKIDGPTVDNSVYNKKLFIKGTMERYNTGAFNSGSGAGAIVSFSGTGSQTLGGVLGDFTGSNAFNNFEINNSAGLRINDAGAIDVAGNLLLTNGLINTGTNRKFTITNSAINCVFPAGGSVNSFIDGPLIKKISLYDNFLYPIGIYISGTGNILGNNIKLSSTQTGPLLWSAEYKNPNGTSNNYTAPLMGVSSQEFYRINSVAGSQAILNINWTPNSDVTPLITGGLSNIRLAGYNTGTSSWVEIPTSATGNNSNGTATSTDLVITTGTDDYTLGSITDLKARAKLSPTGPVCGSAGIPVTFTAPFSIPFDYVLSYTLNGVAQVPVTITSGMVPYSLPTPGPGIYKLTDFTYNSGANIGVADANSITVYASPTTSDAGLDQTQCGITTAVLTGNTPLVGTGLWSILSGTGGTLITPSNPTSQFIGLNGVSYTLRWTISNGTCKSSDDVVINFTILPDPPAAASSQSICGSGTIANLVAIPPVGCTVDWYSAASGGVLLPPGTVLVSGTTYYAESNGGCVSLTRTPVTVTINPVPVPTLNGPNLTCVGATGNLYTTDAGKTNYFWIVSGGFISSGGTGTDNTATVTWNVAGNGTISVNYTDAGCTAASPTVYNVTVLDGPTITLGANPSVCSGITIANLTYSATTGVPDQYSIVYSAAAHAAGFVDVTNAALPASPISLVVPGTAPVATYTGDLTVRNSTTGCVSGTYAISVTIKDSPVPTFTAQPGASACSATDVTYTTQAGQTNYVWIFTGVLGTDYSITSGGTSTDNTVTLQWLTAGAKTVTINYTNAGGCTATAATSSTATTVTLLPVPTFTAQPGASACSATDVTYTTQAGQTNYVWTFTGVLGTDYSITSGGTTTDNTVTLQWLTAGAKTVTINYTNAGGCTAAAAIPSTATTVTLLPVPTFTAQPGATACSATDLTYTTQAGQTNYVWTFTGVPGTDYTITSGGTSTDNTVTLQWLTAGAKTVTINYTNTGGCTAASSASSTPTLISLTPTIADAGIDQTGVLTCGLTTVTLSANAPVIGTGAWSIVSGAGGSFTAPSSPTSTFSGVAGTTYVLRWTISNAPCTPSTDDVTITFNQNPSPANAGLDQTSAAMCGLTSTTLTASTPAIGTGTWSIIGGAGGTVANPNSPTSAFSGTAGTTYVLRWTIDNPPCTPSFDDVNITFHQNPTVANAGPDQIDASTCGLTTVTLAGNNPTVGSGTWSIMSGAGGSFTDASLFNTTFSGTPGTTYVLRWTISNPPCVASFDDVSIKFNLEPTIADAGPDQTGAATCGLTVVTLAANTPVVGTGTWSIISGAGGSFGNSSVNNTTFTGTAGTSYVLRWTISNPPCTPSTDDVNITFNQNPTTAVAGPDQSGAATCGLTTITLAGNNPVVGTGAWSIVSGSGGSFGNASLFNTTFSGTAGTSYVLRWTISNPPCTPSSDDVNITLSQNPTTANAGPDQTDAATCGLTTITLAANNAVVGVGSWSIIGGTGGTVTDPASPISTFSGDAGKTYTLRWTISNPPCPASFDDVNVTFNQNPTAADAGPDQTGLSMCGITVTTLAANAPVIGTGTWTIISGTGGNITAANSPTSTFTGTAGMAYVLRWTISNPPCVSSFDEVNVVFNLNPTPTFTTEPGMTACSGTDVIYTTQAGQSNYTWTYTGISGTDYTITSGGSSTDNSVTLKWLTPGNKLVTVNYSNAAGCTAPVATSSTPTTVSTTLPVSVSIAADANPVCAGTTVNFSAIPTNGGAAPSYQWYNGASAIGTNSPTYSYVPTNGDVITVVLTSSEICQSGGPATSNAVAMTVNPIMPVSVTISADANPVCAGTIVNFTATPVNGGLTPVYQWYKGATAVGTNSPTYSYVPTNGDIITVVLTSSETCQSGGPATSNAVTMSVNPILPVSVTISADAATVCAGTTVNFTATPTNGGLTPSYQWYNGATAVGTDSPTYSYVSADGDVITVVLTSSENCQSGSPATSNAVSMSVNAILPVSVTIAADANPVCDGTTVNFTAAPVNGGLAPSYQWYNGATAVGADSPIYSYIPADGDVITVVLTSSVTCQSGSPATSNAVAMNVNSTPSVIITDPAPVCSPATVDLTSVSITSGSTPGLIYTYWTDAAATLSYMSPATATAGIYYIKGTDLVTGCYDVQPVTVTVNAQPTLIVTNPSSACAPATADLTSASVTAGSTPGLSYTYWTDATATVPYPSPAAASSGTYYIMGTDPVTGCYDIKPVTVTINDVPAVTILQTDVLCFGSSTGAIDISATGGTAPYIYTWTGNGVTPGTEDQSNLSPGSYSVTVTDANSCSTAANINLTEPATAVSGSITSQSDVTVNGGNDGSVTVEGSGGTPPYLYKLDAGSYQASGTFTSLTAGSYTVTIQDANLCTFDVPVTISQPVVSLSGSVTSQTDVACFGTLTGSVTITASGGVPPYEFSLDAGSYQASGTFGSLAAGDHTVTIRDAVMNTFDVNFTITQPASAVSGSITSQTDVLCYGSNTGSVTAEGSGGIAPYQYKMGSGAYQVSGTFNSLAAGSYTITIQDANLCTVDIPVTISQPATGITGNIVTQTNVTCFGSSDGTFTVEGSGGTAPYQFSLDGATFQASGIFNGLSAGTYTVTISDATPCTTDIQVIITEPEALSISFEKTDASCPGDADGSITLTITGGTQPYSVIWSDGVLTATRTNIPTGTYSAVVTDINGCAASINVEISASGSEKCLVIPDIITPNNDGYNDTWIIKNIDLFPNAEVFIYTRWGKLVFKTRNLSANPWDGTYKGKLLPTDSYHYILHLNDGSEPRSGVISIIR
jgi:gliding motility-associated-like protein